MNTVNAVKTIERFVGVFPTAEQAAIRDRLSRMLRYVICQRLIPRKQDGERVAIYQIVASESLQTYLQGPEDENREDKPTLASAIDCEIERLVRAGIISAESAMAHASDPAKLSKNLASD
jgi:twitching motility protein PilT